MHARNVVVLRQLRRVVGLTRGRWSRNEDLDWVEAAMVIEFALQRPDVLSDTELGMPRELLLLDEFVLLILILKLLLLSSQCHSFEGIRCLHAEVNGEGLLPSLGFTDVTLSYASNHACAHAL